MFCCFVESSRTRLPSPPEYSEYNDNYSSRLNRMSHRLMGHFRRDLFNANTWGRLISEASRVYPDSDTTPEITESSFVFHLTLSELSSLLKIL